MGGRIAGYGEHAERLRLLDQWKQQEEARKALFHEKKLPYRTVSGYDIPEPGVEFRRQWKSQRIGPEEERQKHIGKPVDYYGFDRLPMGDWDFPDPIHDASSVNIEGFGDAVERITKTAQDKNSRYRVYLTPGGVRAFDLTNLMGPKAYKEGGFFDSLKVDPNYEALSLDRPALEPFQLKEAFSTRVSGKPGRQEDFVAFPVGTIGEGRVNPENRRLISMYHDIPIARNIATEGMNPRILPESGLAIMERELPSVQGLYRQTIEKAIEESRRYWSR